MLDVFHWVRRSTRDWFRAILSPSDGERENRRQADGNAGAVGKFVARTLLFPLPIGWGEGQGEGSAY
jgi:hypothetical protein